MAWYFDGSDHVTLANNSALDIPNGDWTFAGWFRLQSNSGTAHTRLLSWGVPGATPSLTVWVYQAGSGGASADKLGMQIKDTSGNTAFWYIGPTLSSYLNEWIPWCFTHNESANQTRIMMATLSPLTLYETFDNQALGAITNSDITAPIYFGASSLLGANRFTGDLGENFFTNTYFGTDQFRAFVRGGRGYKFPGCAWHVPMIGGRYEEWINQLTLSNTGSTDSLNHPPVQLITPRLSTPTTDPFLPEVQDAIALAQDGDYVLDSIPATLVNLVVTQDAVSDLIPGKAGTSELTLTQAASYERIRNRTATSEIELGQLATYVGPKWVEAISDLLLDHFSYSSRVFDVFASSQLVFSQETSQAGTKRRSVETTITLGHVGDNIIKVRSASSQIELTQAASFDFVLTASSQINLSQLATTTISREASSLLNLTQVARFAPFPQEASSQLELTQSIRQNIRSGEVVTTLALTSAGEVEKPIRAEATSELVVLDWLVDPGGGVSLQDIGLRQDASLTHSAVRSAEHLLSFRQDIGFTNVRVDSDAVDATSTLSLSQEARVSLTGFAGSIVNLTHSAAGWGGRSLSSQLVLTDTATVVISQSYLVESPLTLNHAAAYTLILASTKCQYSPFIGESSDPNAPTPPPETLQSPLAGIQVPFQLVYPSVGIVTDAVSLKTPNLGNQDRLAFNRVSRETRGGTLIVFADPIWPKTQTLVLSFSRLLRVEAHALLSFMEDHLGVEIGIIDWEHRFWKGVITTPDAPIIEDRFDSFTVSFEFQGELDPSWSPQVVPPSLRYSAIRSPQEGGYYVPNEPILPILPDTITLTAEAGSTIIIGNPLYLTGGGLVNPAKADAIGTTQAVGLSLSDVAAGVGCNYITEGQVVRTDWTQIASVANLSPGVTYFLDPSVAGRITATAPTAAGQYVVRIGRAVDTETLDIEIELPILL